MLTFGRQTTLTFSYLESPGESKTASACARCFRTFRTIMRMKISARNQMRGTVEAIVPGVVTAVIKSNEIMLMVD